jgi:hypothetical protein
VFEQVDLLLTSLLVLVVSNYVFYVQPGYVRMTSPLEVANTTAGAWTPPVVVAANGVEVVKKGKEASHNHVSLPQSLPQSTLIHALHLLLHVGPVVLVAYWHGPYYLKSGIGVHTLLAVIIVFMYVKFFRAHIVYNSTVMEMMLMGTVAAGVYMGILATCSAARYF